MQIGTIKLAGMATEQCATTIADALRSIKGVSKADVSFASSRATVTFDESLASLQRLKVAVEDAGYQIAKQVHGEDGACCGGCGG